MSTIATIVSGLIALSLALASLDTEPQRPERDSCMGADGQWVACPREER